MHETPEEVGSAARVCCGWFDHAQLLWRTWGHFYCGMRHSSVFSLDTSRFGITLVACQFRRSRKRPPHIRLPP
jgi:hypothetical protein